MKRPIPYPEARRILSRVAPKDAFWLCTNENLRNLKGLLNSLDEVDDDVFRYHVTRDRNDFEVWIRDILKDKELAREIARVKTKETLIRKINERLELLYRIVKLRQSQIKRKAKKSRKRKIRKRVKKRPRIKVKKRKKVSRKRKRKR